MSDTMIERVALKLAEKRVYDGYNAATRLRLMQNEISSAERDVRAVLEAIREPTKAMVDAACWVDRPDQVAEAFTDMIDAALAEK